MTRKPPLPPLAACLAEAEPPGPASALWQADGHPLVPLPRGVLDMLIATAGPGFAALALLMRDEGYQLAVFHSGGPALEAVPAPLVAILSDRDEHVVRGHYGFDCPTVGRLVGAAARVVFTAHDDDDAALLAGLATVREARGSLLLVDAPAERIPAWLAALAELRPALPILHAGAFAGAGTLN